MRFSIYAIAFTFATVIGLLGSGCANSNRTSATGALRAAAANNDKLVDLSAKIDEDRRDIESLRRDLDRIVAELGKQRLHSVVDAILYLPVQMASSRLHRHYNMCQEKDGYYDVCIDIIDNALAGYLRNNLLGDPPKSEKCAKAGEVLSHFHDNTNLRPSWAEHKKLCTDS